MKSEVGKDRATQRKTPAVRDLMIKEKKKKKKKKTLLHTRP